VAVSQETKLRWFDIGAAAFAETFPQRVADLEGGPFYVCPLCIQLEESGRTFSTLLYPRQCVADGILSAEHVPPESFDGRELLLTCAACNNEAGARLDADARKRENPADLFWGRAAAPIAVRLNAGGHSIAASFSKDGEWFKFDLLPQVKSGKPGSEEGFREVLSRPEGGDRDITVSFYADRHSEKRARVSWLRSAYLLMFALAGYRYIFDNALTIVRRQIVDPEIEHIPAFMGTLSANPPWAERHLLRVRKPEWHQCWAVQMGRHVVFLPLLCDTGFYDRVAAARRPGGALPALDGDAFLWPDQPFFGRGLVGVKNT
jgi:hypothetical protein